MNNDLQCAYIVNFMNKTRLFLYEYTLCCIHCCSSKKYETLFCGRINHVNGHCIAYTQNDAYKPLKN